MLSLKKINRHLRTARESLDDAKGILQNGAGILDAVGVKADQAAKLGGVVVEGVRELLRPAPVKADVVVTSVKAAGKK